MTLYEINQQAYNSLPKMSNEEINKAINSLSNIIVNSAKIKRDTIKRENIYFILLNNELHYYTLFNLYPEWNQRNFNNELRMCLESLGEIKSIEKREKEMVWEFWISSNKKTNLYLFFDYTLGVIEIGE